VLTARVEIRTPRFRLRELTVEDATDRYLAWFRDPQAAQYITAAPDTTALADLRQYLSERVDRDDVLFLGIFDQSTSLHIGNIKYEPVSSLEGYAVMGILIGDPAWRGRGVAGEVLEASGRWLRQHCGILQIVLGVSASHANAIRTYESAGFVIEATPYISVPHRETLTMVWRL
jgi:RimJ/RimL family protein N-acetyltransferase